MIVDATKKHSQAFACTHSMSLTFVSLNVGVLCARDDLFIAAIKGLCSTCYSALILVCTVTTVSAVLLVIHFLVDFVWIQCP